MNQPLAQSDQWVVADRYSNGLPRLYRHPTSPYEVACSGSYWVIVDQRGKYIRGAANRTRRFKDHYSAIKAIGGLDV